MEGGSVRFVSTIHDCSSSIFQRLNVWPTYILMFLISNCSFFLRFPIGSMCIGCLDHNTGLTLDHGQFSARLTQ